MHVAELQRIPSRSSGKGTLAQMCVKIFTFRYWVTKCVHFYIIPPTCVAECMNFSGIPRTRVEECLYFYSAFAHWVAEYNVCIFTPFPPPG